MGLRASYYQLQVVEDTKIEDEPPSKCITCSTEREYHELSKSTTVACAWAHNSGKPMPTFKPKPACITY